MAVELSSAEEHTSQERGIPADARVRFELLEDCREAVVSRLCTVIGDALNKMSEELTALALKSTHRDEQKALMDAVSVVRQNRSEIEVRFKKAFIDCFERRLFQKKDESKQNNEFSGELTLMDDAILTDKMSVDRLVNKTRGKLDPDEVLGIRARLAALLERDWFDEAQHPAAPEAVFEALKVALSDLAPQADIQSALLDAFEPHVSANLNQVYSSVNDRLKARKILPKIKQQVTVAGGGARKAAANGNAAVAPDSVMAAAQGGADYPVAHYPGGPTNGNAMPSHGGPIPGAQYLDQQQQASLISALNASMQQLAQGVPSARASVARFLTDPDTFGVADIPLPAAQPNLIESIGMLQAAAIDSPIANPQILAELADRARETGSPLDQLTVEIVAIVFDYIYADKRLADVVKQQLLRLQVVAVKAALLDRSFFARRQHPMRQMIDRISEIATDPDTDLAGDGPVVKGMEQLVAWVLVNFDCDLAIFEESLSRLDAIAQQEAQRRHERIAQMTRRAEQIEMRNAARDQAKMLLTDRVDEASPAFVKAFLVKWWSEAAGYASIAAEGEGLRSAECMQLAEALIWSVVPKVPSEIGKLAAMLPKLITGLMKGIKPIDMPSAERETFFNELLRYHTKAIESAKQAKPAATVAARGTSRIRMRSDGSIQFTPPRGVDPTPKAPTAESMVARGKPIADVQRGDRIEVDEGGELKQYKLAWISPSQKLYILSRFPDEARSLEASQFAELFKSGKAKVIERRSSMDQAIGAINVSGKEVAAADAVAA